MYQFCKIVDIYVSFVLLSCRHGRTIDLFRAAAILNFSHSNQGKKTNTEARQTENLFIFVQ